MVIETEGSYDYEDYDEDVYDKQLFCYCEGLCPSGEESGICHTSGGKCFSVMKILQNEDGEDYPVLTHGCFGPGEMGLMQCRSQQLLRKQRVTIACCDAEDFCNRDLIPIPGKNYFKSIPFVALLSSLAICFVVVIIMIIIFLLCKKWGKKTKTNDGSRRENSTEMTNTENLKVVDKLFDLVDQSSASGSGLPMMVQRTIAKQVEMGALLGRGRFGEVWLAKWREEKVAVKVFFSREERSWFRETEIYHTVLMKHENILGFIAADIKGDEGWTQLLLITDYHERGSLYDFLQRNTLNSNSLLVTCMSITKGLSFLHTEIYGVHNKPSIAHRDITSKNILVKRNEECCISDFGMAVKFDNLTNTLDIPVTERGVSRRYMAPEILDNRMDLENFDAYKRTDMYACGLVFWEMIRTCQVGDNTVPPYAPPYHENVPPDPTIEQMYEVVCLKKIRPAILPSWNELEILQTVAKIIQELWHDNPAVRLTALRVMKTLQKWEIPRDISVEME